MDKYMVSFIPHTNYGDEKGCGTFPQAEFLYDVESNNRSHSYLS